MAEIVDQELLATAATRKVAHVLARSADIIHHAVLNGLWSSRPRQETASSTFIPFAYRPIAPKSDGSLAARASSISPGGSTTWASLATGPKVNSEHSIP
jgi:hypothetical protein